MSHEPVEFQPKPLLRKLLDHEVDFVPIGGLAGIARGSSYPSWPPAFPRSAAWVAAVLVAESGTEAATNANPASAIVNRANRFIEASFQVEADRRRHADTEPAAT